MENVYQILIGTSLLRLTNFMGDPEAMSIKIFTKLRKYFGKSVSNEIRSNDL